jgi:hypothetical protein
MHPVEFAGKRLLGPRLKWLQLPFGDQLKD